jgi:esterase/lipase superfamily enzyme
VDESQILVEALAAAWPEKPGRELAAIEPDLIDALRELDGSGPGEAERVQDRILELIRAVPALDERVQDEIESRLLTERGVEGRPAVPELRRSGVALLYATDRSRNEASDAIQYGAARGGEMCYGVARVAIPDDHRMGRLPRPRRWPLRFSRPAEPDVELAEASSMEEPLAHLRDRAPGRDALVFVHGYNVGFTDAARRTAQLAYDLDFSGVPVLYSWPSEGATLSYTVDGENAAASQRHFRAFLRQLIAGTDGGRVHVVAHSMGNRILTEALSTVPTYRLGQVVFAAPDVDAQVFAHRAAEFTGTAERYTLYVSDRDLALATAKRIAGFPRAGSAGMKILVLDRIDTIDASELDTGFLSHSYPLEHRSVVADLYALLRHNQPPDERFGMCPMMSPRGPYWKFRP